jgi:hypothetical protein
LQLKAPAPTPAPSIAPLAEIDVDPPEDDTETLSENVEMDQRCDIERKKKRREKKEKEAGSSQNKQQGEHSTSSDPEKAKRNAICPWEDEYVKYIYVCLRNEKFNCENMSCNVSFSSAFRIIIFLFFS